MVIACGLQDEREFTETVLEYHLKKFILNFKPSQLIIIKNEFTKNRIEEIKANGYQLDFSNVFNLAFENYKKIALYAGSLILVFYFVIFAMLQL
jgi:hypothetical protein